MPRTPIITRRKCMYDAEKDTVQTFRLKFDTDMEEGSGSARASGTAYMIALGVFVDAFNEGPGKDSQRMGADTTGTLHRLEDDVVWAEGERHRVRRALTTIA